MRIYDLHDKDGQLVAFEIDNGWLQPRGLRRVVSTLPGARMVALPPATERLEGERARFEVAGTLFLVMEPFGDNSRYWVGPEPARLSHTTPLVRAAFAAHQPAMWFQLARFLVGVALLGGCIIPLAIRFGPVSEAWAGLGVAALVSGAIGFLALIVVAVLGLAGGSTRTLAHLLRNERSRNAG